MSVVRDFVRRWDSLVNALSGLGTSTDKGTTARPDVTRERLKIPELESLYRFNPYARKVVNYIPEQATRNGWRVTSATDSSVDVEQFDKLRGVWAKIRQAATTGRLYRGAVMLMVTDDGLRPNEPLDLSRVRQIKNLVTFAVGKSATPAEWVADIEDERYREPKIWHLHPTVSGARRLEVHHSRVLYFPGAGLPAELRYEQNGEDDSVLDMPWDAIRNLTSTDQAMALLAQELKINVLRVSGLSNLKASEQEEIFNTRLKALEISKSLHNMILLGDGDEFDTRATPITGFGDLANHARAQGAAAIDLPQTELFGDAPGGLSPHDTSGRDSMAKQIAAWQENVLYRELVRLYTAVYAMHGEEFTGDIEFNPIDEPSDRERLEIEKLIAETDEIRIRSMALPPEHVSRRYRDGRGVEIDLPPYDPDEGFDDDPTFDKMSALIASLPTEDGPAEE